LKIDNIEIINEKFVILRDSIKISKRAINKKLNYNLFNRTIFLGVTEDDASLKMDVAENELNDLIVLSLFANFERQLRDDILNKSSKLNEITPNDLGSKIYELASEEMERWQIEKIIKIYKFAVSENIISELIKILRYRNWIAHGKNQGKIPDKVDPRTAYETIKDFILSVEKVV